MKENPVYNRLARFYPKLGEQLISAKMKTNVYDYIKRSVLNSLTTSLVLTFLIGFLLSVLEFPWYYYPIMFFIFIFGIFQFFMRAPSVYILKKKKEIDKNVLFAGQYLLVKIESGEPLYNTLVGVAKSFGATGEAFKEIVQYMQFGDSIEEAIDRGIQSTPSPDLQKLLWEISNSVKTGTDIKRALRVILREIQSNYTIQIDKYGRKLNSITLFYMVLGIIMPSLGMAMFVIISSFIQLQVSFAALMVVLFFIALIHLAFISIFNTIRPAVDI